MQFKQAIIYLFRKTTVNEWNSHGSAAYMNDFLSETQCLSKNEAAIGHFGLTLRENQKEIVLLYSRLYSFDTLKSH